VIVLPTWGVLDAPVQATVVDALVQLAVASVPAKVFAVAMSSAPEGERTLMSWVLLSEARRTLIALEPR
jgi:hypothetical protein